MQTASRGMAVDSATSAASSGSAKLPSSPKAQVAVGGAAASGGAPPGAPSGPVAEAGRPASSASAAGTRTFAAAAAGSVGRRDGAGYAVYAYPTAAEIPVVEAGLRPMVTVTATGAYVRRCMAAAGLSAAELVTVNYVAGSARRFASAMVTVADNARAEALAAEMNERLVRAGSLGVASSSPAVLAAERGTRVLVRPPFARSTANGSWRSSMEGVATETWPVHLLRLMVADRMASAAGAAIAFGRSDAPWLAVGCAAWHSRVDAAPAGRGVCGPGTDGDHPLCREGSG
jgi:hypothetical protein